MVVCACVCVSSHNKLYVSLHCRLTCSAMSHPCHTSSPLCLYDIQRWAVLSGSWWATPGAKLNRTHDQALCRTFVLEAQEPKFNSPRVHVEVGTT